MITVLSFSQDVKKSNKELSEMPKAIAKKKISSKLIKKEATTKRISEYPGVEWKKEIKKSRNLKNSSGAVLKPKQDDKVRSLDEYLDVKLNNKKRVEKPKDFKKHPVVERKPNDKKKE